MGGGGGQVGGGGIMKERSLSAGEKPAGAGVALPA